MALAATPGFPLGENALLFLQRGYPSANGKAADTDLTPLYPGFENLSNAGKPKLLEGTLGRYSTQIKDPTDGIWRDGPELDLQIDALKVDKVRMPAYDAYGWQIIWDCPECFPDYSSGLPSHAHIEIDRDDPNKGRGFFDYRTNAQMPLIDNGTKRCEVKILRTLFVGRRGIFSLYSPRMRVPMTLKEAAETPSPLINREMHSCSEQRLPFIRPTGRKTGDTEALPLDADRIHDQGIQVAPVSANSALRANPTRITISGGVKGFLTPDGFKILGNWKTQVTTVMRDAAHAQRVATAIKLFPGVDRCESLRRLKEALEAGTDVEWTQLTEQEGNKFRQLLPPYLFLGQEFITKEAQGCLHFDLAEASADIGDTTIDIVQIFPQDLVETVLDTSGLRACARDIGWKDNKLLFELAGSDESKPGECAGLKGYSMVFESKNPEEFGWSLAVPTGQYLQAAAEGELSLQKDVKKGMWILGGCPARWPALCVGQHMVIVPGKKARRCAAHGSPKDRVLLKWAAQHNCYRLIPAYLTEYWDMMELRNYCYPDKERQTRETLAIDNGAPAGRIPFKKSGLFDLIIKPDVPAPAVIPSPTGTPSEIPAPVPAEPQQRFSSTFYDSREGLPHENHKRLSRMLPDAKAEHDDTSGYMTNSPELVASPTNSITAIVDDSGRNKLDNRGVSGVRVSLPKSRPPPPTCEQFMMPPKPYNTQAFRNTEGRRLARPTDPDMQLPDKTSIGIQILVLLSMGAEPCIDVADIEGYFRNFSMPLYRQGTQATSIPFGPHGFGIHKRGEFGKFDMPAATTPAGIFICRATEYVLRQHEATLHGTEYPAALTAAMRARSTALGDQHGQAIYSCIWIDDLLIMYHDCATLRDASKIWLSTQMAGKLGFTCADEKQQLWAQQFLPGPPLKHRLNSFGAVSDYVGLRIHIPRPIVGAARELPVLTVQEPKRLKYADNLATLYQRKPGGKEYVRKLVSTQDLQQMSGQIVAAATTEVELLELCRPFWEAGRYMIEPTQKGRRGPETTGKHHLSNDLRHAAKEIERKLRNPTPLPAAPRVHYPHVRSPGVHLVFSDARRPGEDMLADPASRGGEEFCFGWWCDLGPVEGVVYFQRAFTEPELKLGIPVLEYIGTYVAVMSTYAYWAALTHSDDSGHGHLIAMTDSKTVQQRFKGGKVKGTHMMQMHSIFMDAIATQSCAAQQLHQTPVTVAIDYFTRNYNLMADSLTHGQRGIHDFIQLATMQGFTRIREAADVPVIREAVLRYGHMLWDDMLTGLS